MQTPLKIKLSISHSFINKDNKAPLKWSEKRNQKDNLYAYAAFINAEMTPDQIAQHVFAGKAISVAALTKNYRKEDFFASAQIIGVDFDNGPDVQGLLKDPFINQYAFLIYHTPSSTDDAPRSRAMFLLDQTITDPEQYRRYIKRLMHKYGVQLDEKCKDPVRIFYGSRQPGGFSNASNILPIAVLDALPVHPDEIPRSKPEIAVRSQQSDESLRRYVDKAVDDELARVRSAVSGSRNDTLNKAAYNIGQFLGTTWAGLDRYTIEGALLAAAPLASDFNEMEAKETIQSGLNAGMREPRDRPVSAQPISHSQPEMPTPSQSEPAFDYHEFVMSGKEAMARYQDRLQGNSLPDVEPIVIPFKTISKFGGYARVMTPGRLIGIIGSTGSGKTTFIDSIVDEWRKVGKHLLIYSPEWAADENADRIGQRYGGPTMEQMYLWEVYKSEKARHASRFEGESLSESTIKAGIGAANTVNNWQGQIFFIKRARLSLDELLDGIERTVLGLRKDGTDIRILVIDYAQVLKINARDGKSRTINDAISLIKDLCIDLKLLGVVVSQVTKMASKESKGGEVGEKKLLDETSAQYLRFDEMNLGLSINPNYNEDGTHTGTATINVVKNNIGQKGSVEVYFNAQRLTFIDKEVVKQTLDLRRFSMNGKREAEEEADIPF